ncbi:MAG: peptidoglycan-associated lipoprotein Pal [candidate division Zixibacteria bacterium]
MKKLILMLLLGSLFALLSFGCGPGPETTQPEQPVVVEPEPEPQPEPEPPPPPPVTLKQSQLVTVYFDLDKFNLSSDALSGLEADFLLLQEFGDVMVKMEGHCDERGTVEYNIALGEKRAKAVMDYLIDRGIANARLSTISYGKERPVNAGHNEDAWGKNRRVELKIVSQ